MKEGIITIKLEGVTLEQTERCRQMIHKMFEAGVFNVRNGKAILNFDSDSNMADIEISMKTWSRKHENQSQQELIGLNQFIVEMAQNQSTIAKHI